MIRTALLGATAALSALGLSALGLFAGAAPAQTLPAAHSAARPAAATLPKPTTSHHYIANLHGAVAGPRSVGFNVFDTGASLEQVNALPQGVKAMVWLGQKCPTAADASFRATVAKLATSSKVFGYYLSDEPHISGCSGGPKALASRAAYVRSASGGTQKSFIVLSEPEDYKAFRPEVTGVSMVGIDPYPCSVAHPDCNPAKIDEKVGAALSAGIPRGRIVPVFQAFGQDSASDHYYKLPTAAQMRPMLARWASLVPNAPMDYTYGWGHQDSANPTLVDSAQLRQLLADYFAG
jgi:hypothetical protein